MTEFNPAWEYYEPNPEFAEDSEKYRGIAVADLMSQFSSSSVFLRAGRRVHTLGECAHCNRPIRCDRDTPRRFCSRACNYASRFARSAKATVVPRPCEVCKVAIENPKLLVSGAKFCTRECYHESRRLAIPERTCRACGIRFTPSRRGTPGTACSRTCNGKLRSKTWSTQSPSVGGSSPSSPMPPSPYLSGSAGPSAG